MPHSEDLSAIKGYLPGYKYHWIYTDNGIPIMLVARYDSYQDKTYRQFHYKDNVWVEGMPPSPYPLFGLPTLKNYSSINAIIITEGEKCTTILHQLGWPALSPALGAQNVAGTDWNICRYYNRFIILRDNDKPGISFAQKVCAEIKNVSPNSELFVVNLTPDMKGGDLVDWLQNTVLRRHGWDGFSPLPPERIESIKIVLIQEIEETKLTCEECPDVSFKAIEACFEGDPKPFQIQLTSVPPFPLEIFPEKIQKYLFILASQYSQEPDYAATAFIILSSGLIGRSVDLRMRASHSWMETANSWGILVGPPSSKKSPVLRQIFSLIKSLEKRAGEIFSTALKAYNTRKKEAENTKKDFEELPPVRRRYVTDDVTTPKLRELMSGNPKGLILRNDELKGQLERLDKQGSEGDRSFMMSCWSGLDDYSEDRMCRGSLLNVPLVLTWIGCIPPAPLRQYICEAIGRGGGADGFMQRFQLICYPNHKATFTLPNETMPTSLETEIQEMMEQLDTEISDHPRHLSFNDQSQAYFDQWLVSHENNTRTGVHPLYWESHLGKQSKVVAALTITLHRLKEVLTGKLEEKIALETLQSALSAQAYYLAHARRCYDSVVGGAVNDAETILRLIRQRRLPNRFKAQDIYHQGLGGIADSTKARAALDLLQDYGWVISEKETSGIGRKHEFWIVHPKALQDSHLNLSA